MNKYTEQLKNEPLNMKMSRLALVPASTLLHATTNIRIFVH